MPNGFLFVNAHGTPIKPLVLDGCGVRLEVRRRDDRRFVWPDEADAIALLSIPPAQLKVFVPA